jgi:hypothetical protein
MVVSKEWVNEHQKVVAVAKDTEENWQKRPGDLLMENKHLLLDEALKNNPNPPNHGGPWIQKSKENATVMLGSVPT